MFKNMLIALTIGVAATAAFAQSAVSPSGGDSMEQHKANHEEMKAKHEDMKAKSEERKAKREEMKAKREEMKAKHEEEKAKHNQAPDGAAH